jgi:hypothetical protein
MATTKKQERGTRNAERGTRLEFTCPTCKGTVIVERAGETRACSSCKQKLSKVVQLDQLLARWWEPRRWRADLVRPSVPYLIERLWTANGQGERLYSGVSPRFTNYDIFRNMLTRLMIRGIDEGWAELQFPADPLAEDPQYILTVVDSERFAEGVERLFPEVDWDEPISLGDGSQDLAVAEGGPKSRGKKASKKKK